MLAMPSALLKLLRFKRKGGGRDEVSEMEPNSLQHRRATKIAIRDKWRF